MNGRVAIGRETDLRAAGVKAVVHGDLRIALFATGAGWQAIEDRCTHADVRLSDGWVEGGCVCCPWHGAQFDLATGAVVSGPAKLPVRTFPVTVEEGTVWVDI